MSDNYYKCVHALCEGHINKCFIIANYNGYMHVHTVMYSICLVLHMQTCMRAALTHKYIKAILRQSTDVDNSAIIALLYCTVN